MIKYKKVWKPFEDPLCNYQNYKYGLLSFYRRIKNNTVN